MTKQVVNTVSGFKWYTKFNTSDEMVDVMLDAFFNKGISKNPNNHSLFNDVVNSFVKQMSPDYSFSQAKQMTKEIYKMFGEAK